MKPRTAVILNIVVSLAFAAAIVASGYLLSGTPYKETAMGLLLALWWIPSSYFSSSGCRCCSAGD